MSISSTISNIDLPTINLDAIDVSDVDFAPIFETASDAASSAVVATSKGVFRVVRTARRHPRGSMTILAIILAVIAATTWKSTRASDTDADTASA